MSDRTATPTADGRYLVFDGRRWRATDPAVPEERRQELVDLLVAWRREVRRTRGTDEEATARAGVQAAKVALGERGQPPWWEQTDEERRARWSAEVPSPGAARKAGDAPDRPGGWPRVRTARARPAPPPATGR